MTSLSDLNQIILQAYYNRGITKGILGPHAGIGKRDLRTALMLRIKGGAKMLRPSESRSGIIESLGIAKRIRDKSPADSVIKEDTQN